MFEALRPVPRWGCPNASQKWGSDADENGEKDEGKRSGRALVCELRFGKGRRRREKRGRGGRGLGASG